MLVLETVNLVPVLEPMSESGAETAEMGAGLGDSGYRF